MPSGKGQPITEIRWDIYCIKVYLDIPRAWAVRLQVRADSVHVRPLPIRADAYFLMEMLLLSGTRLSRRPFC